MLIQKYEREKIRRTQKPNTANPRKKKKEKRPLAKFLNLSGRNLNSEPFTVANKEDAAVVLMNQLTIILQRYLWFSRDKYWN